MAETAGANIATPLASAFSASAASAGNPPWDRRRSRGDKWSEKAGWWQATKKFMKDLNAVQVEQDCENTGGE